MQQLVTITSKGQATIPKKFRDKLGLKKQALISMKQGKIVIEKPVDFLTLKGSLPIKAHQKGYTDRDFDKAIGKAVAKRYARSLPNS